MYVQGSKHKKERKKSLEKGQISNFVFEKKDKKRGIKTKLDVISEKLEKSE